MIKTMLTLEGEVDFSLPRNRLRYYEAMLYVYEMGTVPGWILDSKYWLKVSRCYASLESIIGECQSGFCACMDFIFDMDVTDYIIQQYFPELWANRPSEKIMNKNIPYWWKSHTKPSRIRCLRRTIKMTEENILREGDQS